MLKVIAEHKAHRITKSGRFFKVFKPEGGNLTYQRFVSIEAAKCCIDATLEKRSYTAKEYATVYPMNSSWT